MVSIQTQLGTGSRSAPPSRVANGFLIYKWADAQDPNDSFTAQLNACIRYFDIRPCLDSGGVARVCHSLYGDSISDLGPAGTTFTLASAPTSLPDGYVRIYFGATNNAGLSTRMTSGDYVFYLILDNTPPVVTISTPANGSSFTYNGTDVLNYSISDGAGSGVKSFVALIDGRPAPASGQPLLAGLSPGLHTFTVSSAVDQVGNTAPALSVTFTVVAPG